MTDAGVIGILLAHQGSSGVLKDNKRYKAKNVSVVNTKHKIKGVVKYFHKHTKFIVALSF